MIALLAAALLLQAAPAQSEADRVEAAIKKMPDRDYRMIVCNQEIGTLTLKNRVEAEGGRKIAILESFFRRTSGDGKTHEEAITERANLDGLRFLSRRLVRLGDKLDKLTEVKEGKISVKGLDHSTKMVEVTKDTVSGHVLAWFVSVQEQKVGATLKVDIFDYDIQKGYDLRCLERKTVELAGTKHDVFIWKLSGENLTKLPEGSAAFKFEYTYWVSAEGVLLRSSMDAGDSKDYIVWVLMMQAAPPQSEADKLEAALKKFGNRIYARFIDGEDAGYRTLKTSVITDKGRRVAILEASEVESGKTLSTTIEKAELNGLKLMSVSRGGLLGGKSELNTIKVDGLKATLRYAGEEDKVVAITEGTVGEEGLLRRICATEQKEGAELKLDVLRYPAPDIERDRTLKCEGLKPVEIRGKKLDAYLWVEPGNLKYWVSPDGYLLRWIAPGGADFVLDAK